MMHYLFMILSWIIGFAVALPLQLDTLPFLGLFLLGSLLSFAVLWLIAIGILFAACGVVDRSKPETEFSDGYHRLATFYIDNLMRLLSVDVQFTALDQMPESGRFFLVCNHLGIADPALLLYVFAKHRLSFITKKENEKLPVVAPIMHKILCQSIDRENDRASLKGIINAINLIKQDKSSVGIFPEGGVSKSGKLLRFRAGAFKIAQRTKVPIVVCTLRNTEPVFRNGLHGIVTRIPLHLVKVIQPEEYEGMNTSEMADMVYELMIGDLGEELRTDEYRTTEA